MGQSIAIVDASIGETPTQTNIDREVTAETTAYAVSAGEMPPPVSEPASWPHDGIVISGSAASVYDDRPWVTDTMDWLETAHAARIPVLGICWGHQLLAQALGGRVVGMDEYELGPQEIHPLIEDPLFPFADPFVAFETHSDRVVKLPPGAVPLAGNDAGLQAFRIGTAVGVQFHPEYDRASMEWVTEKNDDINAAKREAVMDALDAGGAETARESRAVFDAFEAFVAAWPAGQAVTAAKRA